MITFEDDDIVKAFAKKQKGVKLPKHSRAEDGRDTYLSQSDFGPL